MVSVEQEDGDETARMPGCSVSASLATSACSNCSSNASKTVGEASLLRMAALNEAAVSNGGVQQGEFPSTVGSPSEIERERTNL